MYLRALSAEGSRVFQIHRKSRLYMVGLPIMRFRGGYASASGKKLLRFITEIFIEVR